jgi:MoxR domain in the MoxR-vWA-beta-propeller ternary systems
MSNNPVIEALRKTPNLKYKINNILKNKFVYTEPIADILASAIYSKQNVILHGPGGHGKSEMVEVVLSELGLWDRHDPVNSATLIQSFGEGLTEDALWGGIDFRKLNSPTDPEMWFNVENSFLQYPVAVFEELFDAPAFCLLPLKHTIQSGFLAKNGKSYPMNTELIIACTNRDPSEIAEMGETYRALLERFVLRQEVVWPEYNSMAYFDLLAKHPKSVFMTENTRAALSGIFHECFNSGDFISPRTAMKCVDIIYGAAISRGSTVIEPQDFNALRNVAGFSHTAKKLQDDIERRMAEATADQALKVYAHEIAEATRKINSGIISKVIEWCMLSRSLYELKDKIGSVSVPDSLFHTRDNLISSADEHSIKCLYAARDAIRLPK